jgi:hypothetical protein
MNAMKVAITISLLVTLIAYCSAQTDNDSRSFIREIPTDADGKPDLFYRLSQQEAKQLKLENLQNGYDSLQIRIWYDASLTNSCALLVIKRTNSVWSATWYAMSVDWNAYELTKNITGKQEKTLTPIHGWDNFIKQLSALKIETLPNMRDIPGLKDHWEDGDACNVEIATKKKYRFYSYHLPEKFQDKYWQAKNMVDILNLVRKELGV